LSASLCRGCGVSFRTTDENTDFCPRCGAAYADELMALYAWMREQAAEVTRRRSPAFTELLLPSYRFTLSKTEALRARMLYPEWLADHAEQAEETQSHLESLCLRGKAATLLAVAPFQEELKKSDKKLAASANGAVIDEQTVRAFYYHSRVLSYFYRQGILDHERDFDTDERLARTLLSRINEHAAPLDENDGTFGAPPAQVYESLLAAVFGDV